MPLPVEPIRSHFGCVVYVNEMDGQVRIDRRECEQCVFNLLLCVLPVTEHKKGSAVHEAIMQSEITLSHLAMKLLQRVCKSPFLWKMMNG